MGLIQIKGQGQIKEGHQTTMLRECRVTHALSVIWEVEFDGGIYFSVDPMKVEYQAKLGQIQKLIIFS